LEAEIVPIALFTAITPVLTDCLRLELPEFKFVFLEQLKTIILVTAVRIKSDFFIILLLFVIVKRLMIQIVLLRRFSFYFDP
jgi:hypothetical protein